MMAGTVVGYDHELPYVFGFGDRDGDVGATAAGEAYCVGRVSSDHAVLEASSAMATASNSAGGPSAYIADCHSTPDRGAPSGWPRSHRRPVGRRRASSQPAGAPSPSSPRAARRATPWVAHRLSAPLSCTDQPAPGSCRLMSTRARTSAARRLASSPMFMTPRRLCAMDWCDGTSRD
jgi:hypothetical protein